jgi:hypothetical protein
VFTNDVYLLSLSSMQTHGKHKITQLPVTWASNESSKERYTNYANGALRQSKLAAMKTGAFVYTYRRTQVFIAVRAAQRNDSIKWRCLAMVVFN